MVACADLGELTEMANSIMVMSTVNSWQFATERNGGRNAQIIRLIGLGWPFAGRL